MIKPINILYFTYFIYLLCILGIKSTGNMILNYGFNITLILAVIFSLPSITLFKNRNIGNLWFLFLFLLIITFSSLIFKSSFYNILFILKMIIFYLFLKYYKIDENKFIKFINNTYFIFIFISVLIFVFYPSLVYEIKGKENNMIDLYFLQYTMLHSIEGSAASLDTYSAIILFLNVIVNKSKEKRKFFIVLSAIILLWTFRLTPLISIILAYIAYKIIKKGKHAFLFLSFITLFFILILIINHKNTTVFGIPTYLLLYQLTHARSMIWDQQLIYMFENYDFLDYVFGNFSSESFRVNSFQIDGREKNDLIDNPHNNYLLLFFRNPLFFVVIFVQFLYNIYKKFDKKWFPIIVLIFIGGFTNSQLLSLQNPIYFLILIYFFSNYNTNHEKEKHKSRIYSSRI